MTETQQTISDWQLATFGEAPNALTCAARANEEMAELIRWLSSDPNNPKAASEVADIIIVLVGVCRQLGIDMWAEVDRKMALNRQRKWGQIVDGCGYHLKEPNGD